MTEKSTTELQQELTSAADLHSFLTENQGGLLSGSVPHFLRQQLTARGLTPGELARQAGMSALYLEQLLTARRDPSRDRLLRLCAALALSPREADELLALSGFPPLDPGNARDALILSGLSQGTSLTELDDALFAAGARTLL